MRRILGWTPIWLLAGLLIPAAGGPRRAAPNRSAARKQASSARAAGQPAALMRSSRPTLALQVGHSGPVTLLAFSPDGRILASASHSENAVRLWDVATGALKATLAAHEQGVAALAFSPDGRLLATEGGKLAGSAAVGEAKLWDARDGRLRATLRGQAGQGTALAFSPDGAILAAGDRGVRVKNGEPTPFGEVLAWDVKSGRLRFALRNFPFWVFTLAFSPYGNLLATGAGQAAQLWDARTGQPRGTLRDTQGEENVQAVVFSPDGTTLATDGPGTSQAVRLWDVAGRRVRARLAGHGANVHGLLFTHNGQLLATAGENSIRLWDARTRTPRGVVATGRVLAFGFSPDDRTLATSDVRSEEGTGRASGRGLAADEVRLWDVQSAQLRAAMPRNPVSLPAGEAGEAGCALAFSPDGRTLATGSPDGTLRLWNPDPPALRTLAQGRASGARFASLLQRSPDGSLLTLLGPSDNGLQIWDARSGKLLWTAPSAVLGPGGPFFSPDYNTLASVGAELSIWNSRSGERLWSLPRGGSWPAKFAFSSDSRMLATAGSELRVWESRSGRPVQTLEGYQGPAAALAFSPDGSTLAVVTHGAAEAPLSNAPDGSAPMAAPTPPGGSSGAGEATLWATATGRVRKAFPAGPGTVVALVFSPDGRTVAGSMSDKTIRLWDVATGRLSATLEGVKGEIHFSPDGRIVAAEAGDGSVRLWEVATGRMKALQAGAGTVQALTFSADGRTLAAVTMDIAAFTFRFQVRIYLWDVASGKPKITFPATTSVVDQLAFTPDGRAVATLAPLNGSVCLWDTRTGRRIPLTSASQLKGLPRDMVQPAVMAGNGASLLDPCDGRVLATFLPMPEVEMDAGAARPIEVGARPIEVGARAAEGAGEWFVSTPEGYFDCSANAAKFIRWNVNGTLYPAERYLRRFRRPDLVQKALRGERITAPAMTAEDVPPSARFVWVKYGGPDQKGTVSVTVQAEGRHEPKEMALLVNGRPLPPERAQPVVTGLATGTLRARPIEVGSRPIELGARPIELGAKPIEVGSRPAGSRTSPTRTTPTITKRFTFQVALPQGAETVRLRAVAYDRADLGSSPAEIELRRPGVKPVPGNLYALCVGVSRYRNGRGAEIPGSRVPGYLPEGEVRPILPASGADQFSNLKFPSVDALSMAERLQKEGRPLYEQVEVRTLVDEQATLTSVRAGLKWLQEKARPGQVDTVVVYLSGHGVSDARGGYHFPTYEFDRKNVSGTSLSGAELQQALGGALRAKAVFLFVDTCHSGALAGARGDDLNFEVTSSGVCMMASSGATQYSYESPKWGHGAFTYALLRSLGKKELAREGIIHFNVLTYAVPEELMAMLKEAGQNPGAMEPVVPLEGRRLDEPVAQAGR